MPQVQRTSREMKEACVRRTELGKRAVVDMLTQIKMMRHIMQWKVHVPIFFFHCMYRVFGKYCPIRLLALVFIQGVN